MSGGHFDYGCFKISQFADELKHEIEINDVKTLDEYGDRIGAGYSSDTMKRIKFIHKIIEISGQMAREIEWLYSGDHGEESFLELVDKKLKEIQELQLSIKTQLGI